MELIITLIYLTERREKMENKLIINQIIPFSNVDGSGNRCAIFLQGCNISCIYCHNPETINHCNDCGECLDACKYNALSFQNDKIQFDNKQCTGCNTCINVCPNNSSPKIMKYSVVELVEVIKQYMPFIRGITISGGEPTLQKELIIELFKSMKPLGLTCYIDTNGFFDIKQMESLIDITDKFLFDVKTVGDSQKICGVANLSSLATLEYLLKKNKIEEVRTVIVKTYMDGKKTVKQVANLLLDNLEVTYKITKVHTRGLTKKQLMIINDVIPSDKDILELVQMGKDLGLQKIEYVL